MVEIIFEMDRQSAIDAMVSLAEEKLGEDKRLYVGEFLSAEPDGSISCTLFSFITREGTGLSFDDFRKKGEVISSSYTIVKGNR